MPLRFKTGSGNLLIANWTSARIDSRSVCAPLVQPPEPSLDSFFRAHSLVIAALGILKAGAAYVPVDPGDPAIRSAIALEDSGCKFVVTEERVAGRLPAGHWQTVVLTDDSSFPSDRSQADGTTNRKLDDLAYVIFTSGSTGRPKGVQITHANLLNLIDWHNRAFNVTADDQSTMQASPAFDAAVWELWPSLAAGATVHIIEDSLRSNPELLRDWMVEKQITISFVSTALAESMISFAWPA